MSSLRDPSLPTYGPEEDTTAERVLDRLTPLMMVTYHTHDASGRILTAHTAPSGIDCNGVVFGPPWPFLERGDYITQLIRTTGAAAGKLTWHAAPQDQALFRLPYAGGDAGAVFGPVHEVFDQGTVFWAKIPIPLDFWCQNIPLASAWKRETKRLVWVAVARQTRARASLEYDENLVSNRHYATMIPRLQLESWRRAGWTDTFFDDQRWYTGTLGAIKATCKCLAEQLCYVFDFRHANGSAKGGLLLGPPAARGQLVPVSYTHL